MNRSGFFENIGVLGEVATGPRGADYLKSGDVLIFGGSNIGMCTANGGGWILSRLFDLACSIEFEICGCNWSLESRRSTGNDVNVWPLKSMVRKKLWLAP